MYFCHPYKNNNTDFVIRVFGNNDFIGLEN